MQRALKIKIWLYIWYFKNLYGYNNISTKLIYAQAWHETGNFKSEVFKQNNNLFGMRQPSKRKTFATGSHLNHATFKNHFDSVRDYFEHRKYFKIPNTSDQAFIDVTVRKGYAEDQNYKKKWIKIFNTIKPPAAKLPTYAVILFFFPLFSDLYN